LATKNLGVPCRQNLSSLRRLFLFRRGWKPFSLPPFWISTSESAIAASQVRYGNSSFPAVCFRGCLRSGHALASSCVFFRRRLMLMGAVALGFIRRYFSPHCCLVSHVPVTLARSQPVAWRRTARPSTPSDSTRLAFGGRGTRVIQAFFNKLFAVVSRNDQLCQPAHRYCRKLGRQFPQRRVSRLKL